MTPSARIAAAIEILNLYASHHLPLDRACDRYFRARRYIGAGDRRFISHVIYAVMREQMKLDWWLTSHGHADWAGNARLRILTALYFTGDYDKSELTGFFADDRWASGALSEAELSYIDRLHLASDGNIVDDAMDDSVRLECPAWALNLWRDSYPNYWMAELEASLGQAPIDLRVNSLKSARDTVLKKLPREWDAVKTPLSPHGVRIDERHNLGALDIIKNGEAEVQDEGSQLIAILCDAKPGLQILDLCAGAGGKSLALAAEMENKGRIVVCDNHDRRLKKSVERFRRAGVHNHEFRLLDDAGNAWLNRQSARFDRVLCDVPCTGTGTWRRNPDMRYKLNQSGVDEILAVQSGILDRAAGLVKMGGYLIYATCSILRAENESQIEQFLTRHPQFSILPDDRINAKMPANIVQNGVMRLSTARHKTDGFFAAVLVRGQQA